MNLTDEAAASESRESAPGVNHELAGALEEHLAVCKDLLALAHKESDALKNPTPFPATALQAEKRTLLCRLESALKLLIRKRTLWQQSSMAGPPRDPHVARRLQAGQDMIMRLLVLDRENEQHLLRRGLLPARSLPPSEQSRPSYVARLYQRHAQA
jgi:hypothetical protein